MSNVTNINEVYREYYRQQRESLYDHWLYNLPKDMNGFLETLSTHALPPNPGGPYWGQTKGFHLKDVEGTASAPRYHIELLRHRPRTPRVISITIALPCKFEHLNAQGFYDITREIIDGFFGGN